jgi:hypothetical protein
LKLDRVVSKQTNRTRDPTSALHAARDTERVASHHVDGVFTEEEIELGADEDNNAADQCRLVCLLKSFNGTIVTVDVTNDIRFGTFGKVPQDAKTGSA